MFGGGLRVRTTIDLGLQQTARDAISKWLTDADGPSAALVAIDPRDGAVRAMVGGNNYRKSQFNLAVQGVRQPGSSFKPFVLATALRQGISPATRFQSEPQSIDLGDRDWVVGNYDDIYYGNVDLEKATVESDNAVYAQLTQLVGSKKVAETAKRLGIRSKLDGYYAIGLGAEAVTPLELARAYATIANGGERADGEIFGNRPRVIDEVTREGRKRYNRPKEGFKALTPTQAGVVNSILQQAVRFGTGKRAYLPNRPMAGKTGTTENYGDAWFVGYTPQLVVAVWVGYPTTLRPMLTEFRGEPVTGGTFPALIWKSFMEKALKDEEPEGFPAPLTPYVAPKLVVRRGDRLMLDNGLCRERREVVYFAGTGPNKTANCLENEVQVPDVRKLTLAEAEARVEAQPLTAKPIYKPAGALQRVGVVVDQIPRRGYRSSYDELILIVTKATRGVIPNLVGRDIADARKRLKSLKLEPVITWVDGGTRQRCSSRRRRQASRRRPGSRSSWSFRGRARPQRPAEPARARLGVAPRLLDRDADPDPRSGDDLRTLVGSAELERRLCEREAVVLAGHAERLAEPARSGGEQPRVVESRAARASPRGRRSARAPGSAPRRRFPPPRRRGSGTSGFRTSGRRTRGRPARTSMRSAACGHESRALPDPRSRRPRPRRSGRRRRRPGA